MDKLFGGISPQTHIPSDVHIHVMFGVGGINPVSLPTIKPGHQNL